jgi:hypothetical protein
MLHNCSHFVPSLYQITIRLSFKDRLHNNTRYPRNSSVITDKLDRMCIIKSKLEFLCACKARCKRVCRRGTKAKTAIQSNSSK